MTLISHSLRSIRDSIPPAKQQWSRIQTNATLAIFSAAVLTGVGCFWEQISSATPPIPQMAVATGIGCYLAYRLVPRETENVQITDTVKQAAECILMAPKEGQMITVEGQEFLALKEKNNALEIYSLSKTRPLSADGKVIQLQNSQCMKVMKMPREGESSKKIENARRMVNLVNPDGNTRGCITAPYLVMSHNAMQQPVVRGTLMRGYDSDAQVATGPNGIITALRKAPDSEAYFVDMAHQALSILAKLQETGIAHNDIRAANVFISRTEEGFLDFHLGDWDEAFHEYPGERRLHARDVYNMGKLLSECVTGKADHLKDLLPQMLAEECDARCLLSLLNESLAWAALPNAPLVWQKMARRAGLMPNHS